MDASIFRSAELLPDLKPNTSCDYHRVVLPFSQDDMRTAKVRRPVVWFNRIHSRGLAHLRRARAEGVAIVCDLDDLPELDEGHYLYEHFRHHRMTEMIVESARLADIVTVTTGLLAKELAAYGIDKNRIVVIPNALPFGTGQFVRNQKNYTGGVIYAAGASHYRDARLLPKGLPNLTIAGYEPSHPEWSKVRDYHTDAHYAHSRPLSSYMGLYEGHKIALAPLRPGRFNACKSNLKILEAGARGLPIITSRVDPYVDAADKRFLRYADSRADWESICRQLLRDKAYREALGQALYTHVRETYPLSRSNRIRREVIGALQ